MTGEQPAPPARATVTFDDGRIGRHRGVPPLEVTGGRGWDDVAEQVHRYARRRLASREVDVEIRQYPDGGRVAVVTVGGFRTVAVGRLDPA